MTAATLLKVRGAYQNGQNMVRLELAATTVSGYTYALDLAPYGGKEPCGILGFAHTTLNSVIVTEAPTTTFSGTTLTITVGGSAVTAKRVYLIWFE